MKKISHHVPECFKPDDPEAARCCAAPLFLLCGLILLGVVLAMFPGCSTVNGIGQDLQDASEVTKEYLAKD